jgi:ATP-dependent helicase Lhr and Lhr-like helicase
VCPYLSCPYCNEGDRGDLLWPDEDRKSGSERLLCLKCHMSLPDGSLALTRRSIQDTPPDLLFTTTEMLNRNSANAGLGRVMGWTGQTAPSLVLLDEVHTYSGVHGAQVALLLRRWRHAANGPATIVGLSATLTDAERFFADLTGLRPAEVEYITPAATSLAGEGREYTVALRADPVSGANLLSTSIQTAMLFGRILDPPDRPFLFGTTGFLFTDDLDVTNRFYDDPRDAEGGQSRSGQPGRKPVLADLRSPDLPQQADRYRDSQSWGSSRQDRPVPRT